ncbi:MAG: DUF4268 domain-containing protein [Ferruginibacter sp.]
MYSKQEAALLTQQFWTAFGGYIAPVLSAEGEKINWINYKTGEKGIRFIMTVDNKEAVIAIILSQKDIALQKIYFDKFIQLKKILRESTGLEWLWEPLVSDQHEKTISRIYAVLPGVNILSKPDWPAIISFFKPRLIALDKFWCEYKYAFEHLTPGADKKVISNG